MLLNCSPALRLLVSIHAALLLGVAAPAADTPQLLEIRRIWDAGEHNAFTDLMRFDGRWLCVFREGGAHISANGGIRVIESTDGRNWNSVALLTSPEVDLRDPKLSLTPDGRLMMVLCAAFMRDGVYVSRQSRTAFSSDGRAWSQSADVLEPGLWLWRAAWFDGRAYGVAYTGGGGMVGARSGHLFTSQNGTDWALIRDLELPHASETTVRILPDGEMIALSRAESPDRNKRYSLIGSSLPPYRDWTWQRLNRALGGPNFIFLPDGRWVAGTRRRNADDDGPKTALAWMTREGLEDFLVLPSGGDNSYPGLVWHDGELWVSYYSSHEGKSSIYLARIRLPAAQP
jgi:hypothetical protein